MGGWGDMTGAMAQRVWEFAIGRGQGEKMRSKGRISVKLTREIGVLAANIY